MKQNMVWSLEDQRGEPQTVFDAWAKMQFLLLDIVERCGPAEVRATMQNWDAAGHEGMTLLHYAARQGVVEAATILLEQGAEINARDANGSTPLHMAMSAEDVRPLLENGAEVNVRDANGSTPLHENALWVGNLDDVEGARELLAAGANANAIDAEGWTPLHCACCRGNADMIRLMLDSGAEASRADIRGRTPLDLARESIPRGEYLKRREITALLQSRGGRANRRHWGCLSEIGWCVLAVAVVVLLAH